MQYNKKVSFIIPIYNVAPYLNQCISSVCNQTYPNIEIVLVDDGSTDNSGQICEEWGSKDERIRIIHKKNGGLSDARNAGLDAAEGEYVCFLDGDDYISPKLVETVLPIMEKGYDMAAYQYYFVSNDQKMETKPWWSGEFLIEQDHAKVDFYLNNLLRYGVGWEATSRMYRRSLIEKYKLRFIDNRKIFAEDLCFTACYCLYSKRICSIETPLYYYCFRNESIMGTERSRLNAGRMNELSKSLYHYFRKQKASDEIMVSFPAIHFLIMQNTITRYKTLNNVKEIFLRKEILADIDDKKFFQAMLRRLVRNKKCWAGYFNDLEARHMIKIAKWWLNGNVLTYIIDTLQIKCRELQSGH